MSQRCRLPILPLLFVVLLASACATRVATKTPTATQAPTATPVLTPPPLSIKLAHPLVWTAHQLPSGLKLTPYNWDGPALARVTATPPIFALWRIARRGSGRRMIAQNTGEWQEAFLSPVM